MAPSPAWKLLRAVHAAPIRGTAESVDALVATATKVLGKLPIYDAEQVGRLSLSRPTHATPHGRLCFTLRRHPLISSPCTFSRFGFEHSERK